MRAEMQHLADEITQAISLLRRHLDWEKANAAAGGVERRS